jgi:threonine synthase
MPVYVTHLESALDGTHLPADQVQTLHNGRPLWVRYDLAAVADAMSKEAVASRSADMWRYRELLPVGTEHPPVTLGEGMSPIIPCQRIGSALNLTQLYVKDESQLPTGSFKSRGLSMAITMAKRFGVARVAIPTAGNAGGATAAYAARAGIEAHVFMPRDTPIVNQYETAMAGAKVVLIDGLISDCARMVREGQEEHGWLDLSTLKEPYRIEGKKTMGLELAEQMRWRLPDVILYPTGGGTGLIGMWKAFHELQVMGWLNSTNLPRMVSVQSDGCCPIARAYESGERFAELFENAATCASGLRVPAAVGDFMILDAVRESNGRVVAVPEAGIVEWTRRVCSEEGLSLCPETACCFIALQQLIDESWIGRDERVVVFNTGAMQKYVEVMRDGV